MRRDGATAARIAHVIVDVPLVQPLDYLIPPDVEVESGALHVVPLGRGRRVGIVVGTASASALEPARLRPLGARIVGPQLDARWLALSRFAADYYHCAWGEVAVPALPPRLRCLPRVRRSSIPPAAGVALATSALAATGPLPAALPIMPPPAPRAEQIAAIAAISAAVGFAPFLLHGITGSGKTEVYLGAIGRVLNQDSDGAQVLLLVPEINLTPQLEARLRARFPRHDVASLHSSLAPADRAAAWMQAHGGQARIVLGTRTAVFASFQRLRLIVVDEEHDTSFKAHGGVPYSARDLAVKRAQLESIPIVLGSATPSLETWNLAQLGRYRLLSLRRRPGSGSNMPLATQAVQLPARALDAVPSRSEPIIETVDLRRHPADQGLTAPLRAALEASLVRGDQSLVFINRRGFAPVLCCCACQWLSRCPHCAAFAAYHKVGACLRCHHCGWHRAVPRSCPECGNQDLQAVGQGTQRVEESLRRLWPQARIARIDKDSTRGSRGASAADAAFEAVHAGAVDILVGTQMITKGHDFQRVTTVGVLNADAQLVAADFRAPERLFAVLMQVAGRAGRAGQASRVLIQTHHPQHPLFAALERQSFEAFAAEQIAERRDARMPPFVHQALLTAAARTIEQALDFLNRCRELKEGLTEAAAVALYDAVPMPLARLAAESRGQLLIESAHRPALHAFLKAWLPRLRASGNRGVLRWAIEVDPQAI